MVALVVSKGPLNSAFDLGRGRVSLFLPGLKNTHRPLYALGPWWLWRWPPWLESWLRGSCGVGVVYRVSGKLQRGAASLQGLPRGLSLLLGHHGAALKQWAPVLSRAAWFSGLQLWAHFLQPMSPPPPPHTHTPDRLTDSPKDRPHA